jgi:hypothetical protein
MPSSRDPDAREVVKVEALATVDDAERAEEFLSQCVPFSGWLVRIRTAEVPAEVRKRVPLGTFDERVCTCVTLRLDRPVPVEPGLRIRMFLEDDPTLTASAVVRPWGG